MASAPRWSTRCPRRCRWRSRATAPCGSRATPAASRRPSWSTPARCTTAAAPRSASSRTREIFGTAQFSPARLYRLCRSKAYLFRGVEIRWVCDPSLLKAGKDDTPAEAVLHFPGGLRDSLEADIGDTDPRAAATLGGRGRAARAPTATPRARWNGPPPGWMARTASCTPTATPSPPRRAAPTKPACALRC